MPSKPLILALTGPKSSGKSTLAKALVAKYPDLFIRQRFAEGLKLMLAAFFRFQGATESQIEAMLDGDLKEEPTFYLDGNTPRLAMQTLGTEWRDMISRDLWAKAWLTSATIALVQGRSIIVDDCRFNHEALAIWNLEGLIIRINREGCLPGPHPSESEYLQIKPDLIIQNLQDNPNSMLIQLEQFLGQIQ